MARYKLLAGGHTDDNGVTYHARDPKRNIITTDKDLVKKFGIKFRKLSDRKEEDQVDATAVEGPGALRSADMDLIRANYEAMTKDELLKHAEAEEMDLQGAKNKSDVIAAMMLHEEGAAAK